jgi:glycosyltransferase involved in cell wall biosynthesis
LVLFRGKLLESFVKKGHEVIAYAPEGNEEVLKALDEIGVKFETYEMQRTGLNVLSDLRFLARLTRTLREEGPDIVFCYTIKPIVYGSLASRMAGVEGIYSIVTGLGSAFNRENLKQKILAETVKRLYRFSLKFNKKIFFQNPDDREHFLQNKIVGDKKKTVLINGSGVDLEHFHYVAPGKEPIFLLIARLIKDKGILEYAEAARILKRKYGNAEFWLLGPVDTNPGAIEEETLKAWEKEGNIKYLGMSWEVRPFLAEANVYVLPSYREGTPRSVLEAMATGRPVVTTDAPGCRETVVDGENGFLVKVKDVKSLARSMEKFITDPELIETLGRRGRALAEQKYDVRKVNSDIMKAMGI